MVGVAYWWWGGGGTFPDGGEMSKFLVSGRGNLPIHPSRENPVVPPKVWTNLNLPFGQVPPRDRWEFRVPQCPIKLPPYLSGGRFHGYVIVLINFFLRQVNLRPNYNLKNQNYSNHVGLFGYFVWYDIFWIHKVLC